MSLDIVYYFSARKIIIAGLIILAMTSAIIYYSLLFFPDAWQYSLLFSVPLVVIIIALPNYIKRTYYLVTKKPALQLTTLKLMDHLRKREYKWVEVDDIGIFPNEGKALGNYIGIRLNGATNITRLTDGQLQVKQGDLFDNLLRFHQLYGKDKH